MTTQNAKRAYSAPQLTVHGDVETVTQTGSKKRCKHGYWWGHCKSKNPCPPPITTS